MDIEFESRYKQIEGLSYEASTAKPIANIEDLQRLGVTTTFKIAVVGSAKGGKSTLINGAHGDYLPTLGM
jgi:GTPase SAR1 family protein